MPLRRGSDALTATAIRGSLVITVVERGELDSAKSLQIVNELEGREGAKIASIIAEGTHVKKGEEVLRFDSDFLLKNINDQEVKWEQAVGKVKATKSSLEVQKNK